MSKHTIKKSRDFSEIVEVEDQICPGCSKKTYRGTYYYFTDIVGKTVVYSFNCTSCDIRSQGIDVLDEPCSNIIKVPIRKAKDLETKVIKVGECTLEIPELGIDMDEFPNSEAYVTNLEDILRKFVKQVDFLLTVRDDKDEKERLYEVKENIAQVIAGEQEVTVVLKNISGFCKLIGEDTTIESLKITEQNEFQLG